MKNSINLLTYSGILIFITVVFCNITYAQCGGMTKEEMEQFGSWTCPFDNFPHKHLPGMPGNPNPMVLPPVTVPGHSPSNPNFPGSSPSLPPGVGGPAQNANKPCPGDALKKSEIAPSSGWNINGGRYGFTRSKRRQFHDGLDIKAAPGTPVHSMYEGIVTNIVNSFKPGEYKESSYGNFVEIKVVIDGQEVYLKYNHLDKVSGNIRKGMKVAQGEVLGVSGTTGNASSPNTVIIPHVHIQAKDGKYQRTDPEKYYRTKFDQKTGKPLNPCN